VPVAAVPQFRNILIYTEPCAPIVREAQEDKNQSCLGGRARDDVVECSGVEVVHDEVGVSVPIYGGLKLEIERKPFGYKPISPALDGMEPSVNTIIEWGTAFSDVASSTRNCLYVCD